MCSCCQISFRSSVASAKEYGRAIEVVERLGSVDLGREQVVELEPQLLRELAGLGVALVDQLAAVLGDLPLGEVAAARPAAPAEPIGGLVEIGPVTSLLEPVGAGQAREAATDDDDPRRARGERPGEPPAQHGRRGQPGAAGQQLATAQPSRPVGTDLVDRGLARGRLGRDRGGLPQLVSQRRGAMRPVRPSHRGSGYARDGQASSVLVVAPHPQRLVALSSRPFGVRSSRP